MGNKHFALIITFMNMSLSVRELIWNLNLNGYNDRDKPETVKALKGRERWREKHHDISAANVNWLIRL